MEVAKGKRQEDGTYLYTCGKCGGKGHVPSGAACDWCYALDLGKCREAFKVARGKQYYSLLKAILSIIGKQICDDFRQIYEANKTITIAELGYIALKHDINFKAALEWIEENQLMRHGVHATVMRSTFDDPVTGKRRAFKVSDAYNAARAKYPELGAA